MMHEEHNPTVAVGNKGQGNGLEESHECAILADDLPATAAAMNDYGALHQLRSFLSQGFSSTDATSAEADTLNRTTDCQAIKEQVRTAVTEVIETCFQMVEKRAETNAIMLKLYKALGEPADISFPIELSPRAVDPAATAIEAVQRLVTDFFSPLPQATASEGAMAEAFKEACQVAAQTMATICTIEQDILAEDDTAFSFDREVLSGELQCSSRKVQRASTSLVTAYFRNNASAQRNNDFQNTLDHLYHELARTMNDVLAAVNERENNIYQRFQGRAQVWKYVGELAAEKQKTQKSLNEASAKLKHWARMINDKRRYGTREIAKEVGLKTTEAVVAHLERLVADGAIAPRRLNEQWRLTRIEFKVAVHYIRERQSRRQSKA